MEHRNEDNFDENSYCKNGYTNEETFMEKYAEDDDSVRNCEMCKNFQFYNGIASCKKFS
jgi:hypothetical protein